MALEQIDSGLARATLIRELSRFAIPQAESYHYLMLRSRSQGKNDLFETVTHGLPGSAMPSWEGILTEEQRLQVFHL